MAEVLGRTVSVRTLLALVVVALAVGSLATYVATHLPATRQGPNFRIVAVSLDGQCEGSPGYLVSCPWKVALRNDGGSDGTALLVIRSDAYNAVTDQTQTVTCTSAVPRTAHGDTVDVTCALSAGLDRWLRGVPSFGVSY